MSSKYSSFIYFMLLLSAVGSINWGFAVYKGNSLRTFYDNHKIIASFIYIILGIAGVISLGFLTYTGIRKGENLTK